MSRADKILSRFDEAAKVKVSSGMTNAKIKDVSLDEDSQGSAEEGLISPTITAIDDMQKDLADVLFSFATYIDELNTNANNPSDIVPAIKLISAASKDIKAAMTKIEKAVKSLESAQKKNSKK